MDGKFYSGLFEGDSPAGYKLCMGLTGGDFWSRNRGCLVLYYYQSETENLHLVDIYDTDEDVLKVSCTDAADDQRYFSFILRSVSGSGDELETMNPGVMLEQTDDCVKDLKDTGVYGLCCRRVGELEVCVGFYFSSRGKGSAVERFELYTNDGGQQIDYSQPAASVNYDRDGFYWVRVFLSQPGRSYFDLRTVYTDGSAVCTARPAAVDVAGVTEVSSVCVLLS